MSVKENIEQKISDNINVSKIEVLDESHLHEGHAGARPGGESHFAVFVVSDNFKDKRAVERQKIIYKILDKEMQGQIHALRFVGLKTNDEL